MSRRTRRLAAAVATLGVILLATILILTLSTGGEPPPATGAAELIPGDAMLYVHLSTDPARPALKRMARLEARLPDRGASVTAYAQRVISVVGASISTDFGRDLRPWLGKEAAFALLNTNGPAAGSLIVLAVRSRALAQAFVTRAGAQPAGAYRGTALLRYATGAELAFLHGYLVVGLDAGVRAAIDAADGRQRSLASSTDYRRVAGDEPAGRVLDAYISAQGVARVFAARHGVLGAVAALLSQPSLLATAVSVSADAPGVRVHLHSALDAKLAKRDGGRLTPFTPTLMDVLPSGSTLMIDARNLSAAAPRLLQAMAQINLLGGLPDLFRRLGAALTAEGYNPRGALALFDGETAVALARGSGAPALVIVTRVHDAQAARVALANLEAPLTQAFSAPDSGAGVEPEVADVQAGGVAAHEMQLGPGLELDYAVFRGLVVVSTSLRGIADVAARRGALAGDAGVKAVLRDRPDQVTSLGFADFSQLLTLGEQTQLPESGGYRSLQPDLQRIRAAGIDSTRGEADTTAELFLQIP